MTSRRAFLRTLMASSAAVVVAPAWALAEVHRTVPLPDTLRLTYDFPHAPGPMTTYFEWTASEPLRASTRAALQAFNEDGVLREITGLAPMVVDDFAYTGEAARRLGVHLEATA